MTLARTTEHRILTSSRFRTTTTFSQIQAKAAEIKDQDRDKDRNIDRKMCLLRRPLPLSPSAGSPDTDFKDGHSQQIHNYAMTRTKIYVVDNVAAGRTLKIPLNTIDLQATEETNRQAGVDFSIPVSVEGPAKN
jgi:hypothetical protein